jgi:hypothetical protein
MCVQRIAALLCFFSLVVSAQLVNTSQAAVPGEGNTGYIFPPGKYILGGGEKPARGEDVFELKKSFRLRPGQYILSGGPRPTDPIIVDDDLQLGSGDKMLFIDDDHVPSTEKRKIPGLPCTYSGAPIILVLDPKAKLRIQAIDIFAGDAVIGDLYLHRHDGARRRLTEYTYQRSNMVLPHVFFNKEFALDEGFEAPPSIKEVMDMPAIPASLLPKK